MESARDAGRFHSAKSIGVHAGRGTGLRRLETAVDETGPETLVAVLKTFGLNCLERVDKLEILKRVVLAVEGSRQKSQT
jgi:hypothetical protein